MTNINNIVWKHIDSSIAVKKNLLDGLINISALARTIAKEHNLKENMDAIISSIRRYMKSNTKRLKVKKISGLFKKAKMSSNTKLVSVLLARGDETEKKVHSVYNKIKLKRESIFRVFEVMNYSKIIMDEEFLPHVKKHFSSGEILSVDKNLGEVVINYNLDITQTAGVFAALYNEIALNDISIIDSIVLQWEHLIVVKQEDLEKTFSIVLNMTKD